jgi:hypothetical protein
MSRRETVKSAHTLLEIFMAGSDKDASITKSEIANKDGPMGRVSDRHRQLSGKLRTSCRAICAAIAVTTTMVQPAAAQSTTTAADVYLAGAERIDVSDQIRTLSQRIAVASCFVDAGVSVDEFQGVMSNSVVEFDALFAALRDGNPDMGINLVEEDRKMLVALQRVSSQWDNYKTAIAYRIAGSITEAGPDYISRQNLNVMHVGKYLISEVINRYSIPPALLQRDAYTLTIAARQRALSQQIAKEACGVVTGNTVMGNLGRLDKSVRRFDASLNALVDGFPAAGVSAAPTPNIKAQLETIQGDWNAVRGQIDAISGPADVQVAVDIYRQLDAIATQANALVPLYVVESKSGI